MARIICDDDKQWRDSSSDQDDDEEDEALSLCDLPLDLTDDDEDSRSRNAQAADRASKTEEEFDFGSWGGSVLTENEMCAADEVFFEGQILPLRRLSFSSDCCLAGFRPESPNPSRSVSRSESMDHSSSAGLTSISSRSSSINSSSTTSSTSTTPSTIKKLYKPKVRNQFHTHPSPKPQLRASGARLVEPRSRKSSVWDFFRLGLVPTPDIKLQDLKVRSGKKSFGSGHSNCSNSTTNSSIRNKNQDHKQIKRDRNSGFLRGCKCSVETVPSNIVVVKSSSTRRRSFSNNGETESTRHAMQQQELEKKTKEKQRHQGKRKMSRHRTSEWLKELSHASSPDHETTATTTIA